MATRAVATRAVAAGRRGGRPPSMFPFFATVGMVSVLVVLVPVAVGRRGGAPSLLAPVSMGPGSAGFLRGMGLFSLSLRPRWREKRRTRGGTGGVGIPRVLLFCLLWGVCGGGNGGLWWRCPTSPTPFLVVPIARALLVLCGVQAKPPSRARFLRFRGAPVAIAFFGMGGRGGVMTTAAATTPATPVTTVGMPTVGMRVSTVMAAVAVAICLTVAFASSSSEARTRTPTS